jgi:hypothetical protein
MLCVTQITNTPTNEKVKFYVGTNRKHTNEQVKFCAETDHKQNYQLYTKHSSRFKKLQPMSMQLQN